MENAINSVEKVMNALIKQQYFSNYYNKTDKISFKLLRKNKTKNKKYNRKKQKNGSYYHIKI